MDATNAPLRSRSAIDPPRRFPLRLGCLALLLCSACSYTPPFNYCGQFEDAPFKEPAGDPPAVVLMDPAQRFAVFHGSACAKSDEDGEEKIIKVEQSLTLPAFANRATVFLNGWDVRYLSKDHEIEGVATIIGKIRQERNVLTWQAAGLLSDKNFDDGYEWCYRFTIVAWNDPAVEAAVDHDDAERFCRTDSAGSDNFFLAGNGGTTTALSAFSSFLQNPAFIPPVTVAVLPRGFGFKGESDHHLLQMAYNLDHGETFVGFGKEYRKALEGVVIPSTATGSHADSGYVSWDAFTIFKDNDKRRSYEFGEIVSALGGVDVGIVQPPYTILPDEDAGIGSGCVTNEQPDVVTETFIVEGVPFECAVPVLTGWDLEYACDDEQVTEVGVWIEEWSYVPGPEGGTLRYAVSSALRDKDNSPEHRRSQKVAILGLLPLAGVKGAAAAPAQSGGR